MKKLINLSGLYGLLALASGVATREITKAYGYHGYTALGVTHVHLFVLGTLLYLSLAGFSKTTDLMQKKDFRKFLRLYNVALPFMVIMMYVKGIQEILGVTLSKGALGMRAGVSGLSHLLVAVALFFLFKALKDVAKE